MIASYLSQRTFQGAKKVVISQGGCFVVQIVHDKSQLLCLFKPVLQLDGFRKLRALVIFNQLRPGNLEYLNAQVELVYGVNIDY